PGCHLVWPDHFTPSGTDIRRDSRPEAQLPASVGARWRRRPPRARSPREEGMLGTRKRTLTAAVGGALAIIAVCAGVAIGASEDKWAAGANLPWTASSPKTTFVSSVATVTCTTNSASGPTVGAGPDVG